VAEHVNYIEWHTHPFRSDRWLETWRPALDRALAFGAKRAVLTRNYEDRLHFRQMTVWESREDFERYWASDEIEALKREALNYFNKPLLPVWHTTAIDVVAGEPPETDTEEDRAGAQTAAAEAGA
jgi:heme-degrading monooxygenase HmoA